MKKFNIIRCHIYLLATLLGSGNLQAQASRAWKLKSGVTFDAIAVNANFGGIIAKSPQGSKQVFIPYKNLAPSEVAFAVKNLPIAMGSSEEIKLVGQTISSARDNYETVTGYAISFPTSTSSSSSSGNSMSTTSGGVREIKERAAKSSKLVELKMSSICDGVAVWVDFLAIGDNGKRVNYYSKGIYYFKETWDIALFELPAMDNYSGWAFVFRSIETGEVIGGHASSQPLQQFAKKFIDKDGKNAKQTTKQLRKLLFEAVVEK